MNSSPSLPRHVFRLLGRQHSWVRRPVNELETALSALRQEQQDALIELEIHGGRVGYLLFQGGRLVYAQQGEHTGVKVLSLVQQQTALGQLRVLVLNAEQATLAHAAVDGTPCMVEAFRGANVDKLLKEMIQQVFTCVVAVEHGRQLIVLCFYQGHLAISRAIPEIPRIARLTQIVWQTRTLDELSGLGEGLGVPNITLEMPVASMASPNQRTTTPRQVTTPVSIVSEHDSVRIWALFQTVMDAQLGERAERVIEATRNSLSQDQQVEPISIQLALQVERVAGSAAAQDFLFHCTTAALPQPNPN